MEKYIYNEQNGLWYELRGDYCIPCFELPAEKEERHIGVWGQRHLRYICEHKKALYTSHLTSGKLQSYFANVEEQAQEIFDLLMRQRAEREGITKKSESGQSNEIGWQDERSAVNGYGNCQCRGGLRMKEKYHFYLTAEKKWYMFITLLAYRNKLIA